MLSLFWHNSGDATESSLATTRSKMESSWLSQAQRAAPEVNQTVTNEQEAAETLAALARFSPHSVCASDPAKPTHSEHTATCSTRHSQDQAKGETFSALRIPSGRSQCNSAGKLRQNLTKAQKEERRLRRVLSNRDSARQTIRRRQAMHLELSKKAADLLEENENLKKGKEVALEEYNSLKERNDFLKLKMANLNKAEPRETHEEPKSSHTERNSCPSFISPVMLCSHPSLVPYPWPSTIPPSNLFHFPYPSSFYVPSLHHGQEPRNPCLVVPVPCLLPLPSNRSIKHSHPDTDNIPDVASSTHQCKVFSSLDKMFAETSLQLSTNSTRTTPAPEKSSHGNSIRSLEPDIDSLEEDLYDVNPVSAPSKHPKSPSSCHKKLEDISEATHARRRRKELMKLKNTFRHLGT